MARDTVIGPFDGVYRWLSNFYFAPAAYGFIVYPTSEHAYQAAKSFDNEVRVAIALLKTPGEAKRAGRKVVMRPDWEFAKIAVMYEIVKDKFLRNPELAKKLLKTGDSILMEINDWGDQFWGVSGGRGQNQLGIVLMRVRKEIRGV